MKTWFKNTVAAIEDIINDLLNLVGLVIMGLVFIAILKALFS